MPLPASHAPKHEHAWEVALLNSVEEGAELLCYLLVTPLYLLVMPLPVSHAPIPVSHAPTC